MQAENHSSIRHTCAVLEISRSQYYRKVKQMHDYLPLQREASESAPNALVSRAEALAKRYPLYGHRKIHALLKREGFTVSRHQVYMLLKRKNLLLPSTWRKQLREQSKARKEYLIKPTQPLELLQADITHIPVEGYGTYYVIDVIDYYSKYVLVTLWSTTHDTAALINTCECALAEAQHLGIPFPEKVKLLTDNGPAMISKKFSEYIKTSSFQHLRTGNHHPQTNGCIERFHQTLKYEEVWGAMYENPIIAKEKIERFRCFYNTERIHQTLGYKTPLEVIAEYKKQWEEQKNITYSYVA